MPAKKKHPSTRARRNKTAGAATLTRRPLAAVPEPADYDGMKLAELRELIDERNVDGRPADERLTKRGSKAVLAALLADDDVRLDGPPALPRRIDGWTEQTEQWWADVWASPMSDEWDDSDLHNLYLCAALYDDIWTAESAKARKDAAGEFRLQRAELGLSPYSRRRLEWQIEETAAKTERGQQRRQSQSESTQGAAAKGRAKGKAKDPRAGLSVVG